MIVYLSPYHSYSRKLSVTVPSIHGPPVATAVTAVTAPPIPSPFVAARLGRRLHRGPNLRVQADVATPDYLQVFGHRLRLHDRHRHLIDVIVIWQGDVARQ